MVSAIILASGYSKRMGRDKLLLKYRGKTLIQKTIDTILQYEFSEVILVAREEEIIEIGNRNGIKVIKNDNAAKGISESIKLGVMEAMKTDGYMFFTGDQPLMDVETIQLLMNCFIENKNLIIVPRYNEKRGNPFIFPRRYADELLALQGDSGGRSIINKHLESVKFLEVKNEWLLSDIDTEEDYKRLVARSLNSIM